MAENEEQYALSNIVYITIQSCYFIIYEVTFAEGALKMETSWFKNTSKGFIFRQMWRWGPATEPKMFSFTGIFKKFCSDFQLFFKISRHFKNVYFQEPDSFPQNLFFPGGNYGLREPQMLKVPVGI